MSDPTPVDAAPVWTRHHCPLTSRQLQILQLLAHGDSMAQIGKKLFISCNTVRTHLDRAKRLLESRGTINAVAIALRAGWIL